MFKKATKEKAKLRFLILGPSGAGKTYTALNIAKHLVPGGKIAVIDSEHGSASKYAHKFDFDVCELNKFHPSNYIEAIKAAGKSGYNVIIIDSMSHSWYAELDVVGGNFNNFAKVRPFERALLEAMISSPAHIIATCRVSTEWIDAEVNGKKTKQKIGTKPIQAKDIEYEFDLTGEMNKEHIMEIDKCRLDDLSNTTHLNPGKELADLIMASLNLGAEPKPRIEEPAEVTVTLAVPAVPASVAAPVQSIEDMTIEQLYEEFKVRCKTNNLKPAEMFKKLMGDELKPGMTFVTLPLEKARALVLDVVPF